MASSSQQWFPFAVYIESTGTWHYATFFYESLACALIFVFLLIYRRKSKTDGNVFLWYLLLYGIERAFVEGLRTDSLYIGGVVRVSQLLSVVLVIFAAVMLIVRKRKAVFNAGEVDPRLVMLHHETDEDPESAEEALAPEGTEPAGETTTTELAEDAEAAKDAEIAEEAELAKDAEEAENAEETEEKKEKGN